MNHILLIDDENQISRAIETRIKDMFPDCDITKASNFYRAQAKLEDYIKNNIYCCLIVCDQHMPREGLVAVGDQPPGAVLNGWVFLRDYIIKDGAKYNEVCKKAKIVLFSAFLEELREYCDKNSEDQFLLTKIETIPKGYIVNDIKYCA